jgi:four helix bundle protein
MSFSSFRDLRVWPEAMKLTAEVYRGTVHFPRHELYGLTSQMRRAAVSVPSNIAEGKGHHSDKEFSHYGGITILVSGIWATVVSRV